MRSSTPRTAPSRVILDPVTLEPAGFIVRAETACSICGIGKLTEVWSEEGSLVRRVADGQLCWHWRANQSNSQTPSEQGA